MTLTRLLTAFDQLSPMFKCISWWGSQSLYARENYFRRGLCVHRAFLAVRLPQGGSLTFAVIKSGVPCSTHASPTGGGATGRQTASMGRTRRAARFWERVLWFVLYLASCSLLEKNAYHALFKNYSCRLRRGNVPMRGRDQLRSVPVAVRRDEPVQGQLRREGLPRSR
jgi:hypothetical protein